MIARRTAPLIRRLLVGAFAVSLTVALVGVGQAGAAQPPVGFGTATSFAVLAGSTVTNTGPSIISGDLGVSPGTAVTGFPPGTVLNGAIHAADAVAGQAQADLVTAYDDAAGRTPATAVLGDLGGQTLVPGIYTKTTLGLTGTVTLDAQHDPNAVFVLQSASTLITASNSTVALINGADPCNVVWQVGSSATLGTGTTFVGTVVALTSIGAETGASVRGRLLARNGAVTLDTNTITEPGCPVVAPTTTSTTAPTTTSTTAPTTTSTTVPGATTTVPGATTTVPITTVTIPRTATTGGAGPTTSTTTTRPATSETTTTRSTTITNTTTGSTPPLARTGAPIGATTMAGVVSLVLGTLMVLASRPSRPGERRPPTT